MYTFYAYIKFKIPLLVVFDNPYLQFFKFEEGWGHLEVNSLEPRKPETGHSDNCFVNDRESIMN